MLKIRKKRARLHLHKLPRTTRKKRSYAVPILCLVFVSFLSLSIVGQILFDSKQPRAATTPQETTKSDNSSPTKEENMSDVFAAYDNDLYDKDTNTYSFSNSDYDSLFGGTQLTDDGTGLKSGTINRNGETWNVYCYTSSNSCSVSTSSGTYGNVYCHQYSNSCSYSDTDGNYANTYCYEYSNSCSTTDSSGGYSNTYCYEYSNSCTTNNSDGSTTNTYCYEYSNSCSSSTYGGSSSYGSYDSYY